jgi:8-oxo-dGTP diphosphatase
MNTEFTPKTGVGVFVMKEGKVLLGKRKSSHGAGEYATPGGHLEYMESFEDCAKRECMEEAGIEIENVRFAFLYNMKKYAPKHYVHIELLADWKSGDPKVSEPDKCEGWDWYELDSLPEPRFGTEDMVLEHLKNNRNYWDE